MHSTPAIGHIHKSVNVKLHTNSNVTNATLRSVFLIRLAKLSNDDDVDILIINSIIESDYQYLKMLFMLGNVSAAETNCRA